jgi:hypothetical protein
MKRVKLFAAVPLLLGFLLLSGCISAGVGVGPVGTGAYVYPFGAGVYVD